MTRRNIIIMGAAGRDFHNFNVLYKDNPLYNVIAFTAAQIPFIENRTYPKELAGKLYPKGIPVKPEKTLPELIKKHKADEVVFSYSDVSHEYVMHRAGIANSLGADFVLIGSEKTMLKSKKPVISICAVRTGCGKSSVTKKVCTILKEFSRRPSVIRHPMPYGDLLKKVFQGFETKEDIARYDCTIEEMEEFEPLIEAGVNVYAGIDYKLVLKEAEKRGDIIVWDGGNNDTPFIKPDLEIVVLDPHRAGHELMYYPGEVNFRRADVFIINKVDSAKKEDIAAVLENIRHINPSAKIVHTVSLITIEDERLAKGRQVLVVEDGPTLTHGGMSYGAGIIAAKRVGAKIVAPTPYAKGTLKKTLLQYPHLKNLIPAMGYSPKQIKELEETINNTPCDCVLSATPIDLKKLVKINKPCIRVRYEIEDGRNGKGIKEIIKGFLRQSGRGL